ncbi:MAG: F0F1 ATP synthase subunit A [Firmicutes bacterium]|nr:F0F1 ATP synthase subunit A [Bacillota bacterium]
MSPYLGQRFLMAGGGEASKEGEGGLEIFHAIKVFFLEKNPFFEVNAVVVTFWGLMLIIAVLGFFAGRRVTKVPLGLQNLFEMLLDSLENWYGGFMGGREVARRYLPFLSTFFIFILLSNYSGLIPGAGKFFNPPTGRWGTTAGLAIVVIVATHYFAFKEKGAKAYFSHYVQPAAFMLPLNILEEFIKPFSLSLRLFGNIFAEEVLLVIVVSLVPLFVPIPIMALSLLLGGIQAIVFTTLASIYIGSAISGHH